MDQSFSGKLMAHNVIKEVSSFYGMGGGVLLHLHQPGSNPYRELN
jgi:hypothetical protein